MKSFKSKVDWWLVVLLVLVFGYPIYDGIVSKTYGLSIVFSGILIVIFYLARTLEYQIEGELLSVWGSKIEIKSIKKIYRTNIILSAPALSLDRIGIVYNKYDELFISPKNRKEFIEELKKINDRIEVVE